VTIPRPPLLNGTFSKIVKKLIKSMLNNCCCTASQVVARAGLL
jgi:hypothetical protein